MGIVVKAVLFIIKWTIFNVYFVTCFGLMYLLKYYLNSRKQNIISFSRVNGKTAIVTGANTGLGFEIANTLATKGARVILACKNVGSAHQAKAAIIENTGNRNIDIKQVDLSSLWSVRQFAKSVIESEANLEILIHAAGVIGAKNSKTKDDLQITWQINHLSPFLLTNLLLDLMKKSTSSRIIFLSSTLHHFSKLNVDEINSEEAYNHFFSYCSINMANILTANYMAKKLKGTGVTVNTTNPGLVKVKLFRRIDNAVFQWLLEIFLEKFAKTIEEGAATTLMVATDKNLQNVTGEYFSECKISGCLSSKVHDMALAEKLWKKSEELVDLKDFERII